MRIRKTRGLCPIIGRQRPVESADRRGGVQVLTRTTARGLLRDMALTVPSVRRLHEYAMRTGVELSALERELSAVRAERDLLAIDRDRLAVDCDELDCQFAGIS